jgi:hypothetical protein
MIFKGICSIFIIFLLFPFFYLSAQAQNEIGFLSTDKFDIPDYNGSVSFASGGTYELANLENGMWSFVNLQLNNSFRLETFNVSARESDLTVSSIQAFDDDLGAFLSYTVVGVGEQTFNFGVNAVGGRWSVTFNDVFIAENSGWNLLPDNTLSITGATSNVTLLYFVFSDSFPGNGSDKSFFEQHSVSIITGVIAAFVVIAAVLIRRINQNPQDSQSDKSYEKPLNPSFNCIS